MKNIILIGMMGCGKTTKGRAAAEALKLPFYDIDEIIQRSSGMTIPEIFKEYGEAHFRKMEQKALFSLENQPCGIVSTGGGIVCQGENIQFMRRTGDIIWIFRDIEETVADIDAADRPLLSAMKFLAERAGSGRYSHSGGSSMRTPGNCFPAARRILPGLFL